jgi:hypothetical protein
MYLKLVDTKKMVYENFNYNFSVCREKGNCMLFTATENVLIAERYASALTTHVVVHICWKFEKDCLKRLNISPHANSVASLMALMPKD